MPVRLSVQLDTRGLVRTQQQLATAGKRLTQVFERRVLPAARRGVVNDLRQRNVPRPNTDADYPLTWRSERQRRFVMAKLRRENNLPYRRTGRMAAGWAARVRAIPRGVALEVVNPSGVLDFVAGTGRIRQPMFPRWYNYNDDLSRAANEQLVPLIERAWEGILR